MRYLSIKILKNLRAKNEEARNVNFLVINDLNDTANKLLPKNISIRSDSESFSTRRISSVMNILKS